MGDVSERNYGNKAGIGQHRGDGQPALNTGQKNILGTRGDVGNMSAGENNNGAVPASRPDADISTQTGVAERRNRSR
jgi:hypothetical protein